MLNKVRNFIRLQQLLDPSLHYLVAVSGGADSVALLRVLLQLGYQVEACHCNFQLRGEESVRDEAFVKELCEQLAVPFHLVHFDTKSYADLHKVSIEMAARELRYRYFEQLCHDIGAVAVCVAHHGDDNAETLLLNLLRGTGIHGLSGIHPRRPIREGSPIEVLRPLLCVSRSEIEDWLKSIAQTYVTDSSNLVADVMRNQIRLNVLPMLRQLNPAVSDNLQSTALLMAEAEHIYDEYTSLMINRTVKNNHLDIKELKETASQLSILYEWLSKYGFSSATIRQIHSHLDAPTGRLWQSDTHEVCIDRDSLILTERQPETSPLRIPETGLYAVSNQFRLRVSISSEVVIDRSPQTACLDADKVSFPLTLRTVREGDRFVPFGMRGSKLLSDFLTDQKLPVTEKRRQLVVTDSSDNILWVVGRRIAQPYSITSSTQKMIKLEYILQQ